MTAHPPQFEHYTELPRPEVVPYLPDAVQSAVDVGCGQGGFGPTLRARYPDARLMGIEATATASELASVGHGFDEVLQGYFPDVLHGRDDRFDLITFNDVLEHIVDPWALVAGLHDRLTPGGHVVATIPNVQYIYNLTSLMAGNWEYEDQGILDRTHVRFFTKATSISLFSDHGFDVISCEGANPSSLKAGRPRSRLVRQVMVRLIPDSRFLHFVVVARSPGYGAARTPATTDSGKPQVDPAARPTPP